MERSVRYWLLYYLTMSPSGPIYLSTSLLFKFKLQLDLAQYNIYFVLSYRP